MEITSSFPERLQEAMGSVSSTKLAASIGISKQSVSAYLKGTRKPKRFVIEAIARELNVNPVWLCGYDALRYIPAAAEIAPDRPDLAPFSEAELDLIANYRRLPPAGKEYVLQTVSVALQAYSEKNDTSAGLEKAN